MERDEAGYFHVSCIEEMEGIITSSELAANQFILKHVKKGHRVRFD